MLYQDNYFFVSVKLNFCQRQIHCINGQDKVESVADTDSEFTESQTLRKNLQSISISRVTSRAYMETLKSKISEAYKTQVDCLKDSEFHSYDKIDMKEKVNDLVRLYETI